MNWLNGYKKKLIVKSNKEEKVRRVEDIKKREENIF